MTDRDGVRGPGRGETHAGADFEDQLRIADCGLRIEKTVIGKIPRFERLGEQPDEQACFVRRKRRRRGDIEAELGVYAPDVLRYLALRRVQQTRGLERRKRGGAIKMEDAHKL